MLKVVCCESTSHGSESPWGRAETADAGGWARTDGGEGAEARRQLLREGALGKEGTWCWSKAPGNLHIFYTYPYAYTSVYIYICYTYILYDILYYIVYYTYYCIYTYIVYIYIYMLYIYIYVVYIYIVYIYVLYIYVLYIYMYIVYIYNIIYIILYI